MDFDLSQIKELIAIIELVPINIDLNADILLNKYLDNLLDINYDTNLDIEVLKTIYDCVDLIMRKL